MFYKSFFSGAAAAKAYLAACLPNPEHFVSHEPSKQVTGIRPHNVHMFNLLLHPTSTMNRRQQSPAEAKKSSQFYQRNLVSFRALSLN